MSSSDQQASGQGNPIPIIIVSALFILPISLWTIYKLFVFYGSNESNKTSKFIRCNQITFYSACIVFAISYPLSDIFEYLSIEWRIIFAIETLTHGLLHFYALINIFYARLIAIFSDTDLALQRSTKLLFNTLYAIFILLGIASWTVILYNREDPNLMLMMLIAVPYLLIMIFITQFLSCLFIAKLRAVNKDMDNASPFFQYEARRTIRKFTILSVVAMSGTLLYIMFIGTVPFVDVFPTWLVNMMKQIDLLTNLICVSLSFKFAHPVYSKCCRFCEYGCRASVDAPVMLSGRTTITARNSSGVSPSSQELEVSV